MKTLLTLSALLLMGGPLAAQTLSLPKDRISDEAIQADQRSYEALQARIKGLNDKGRPLRDYFIAKAQCWLDVSFHEYTRNDRSAFPQAAMDESLKLVVGLERGTSVLPMETPLVNDAAKLRPDLWARTESLKASPGFRCAQRQLACAEVELVHAGNEFNQQQWRHAQPYVQIAEDQITEAATSVARCEAPPTPAPVALPAPVPAPVAPAAAPVLAKRAEAALTVNVVFNFDRSAAKDVRPFSVVQLEEMVVRVKREKIELQTVRLVGHADRLNGTGSGDYNQRLSEKRVATVKDMLLQLGIAPGLINTDARGDSQQVTGCESRFKSKADLEECLLPNRRVEVLFEGRVR